MPLVPPIGTLSTSLLDASFMGQDILNPPTVEGWHTGTEWLDTGTLMERVNSAALQMMGDPVQSGVQSIIGRLRAQCSTEYSAGRAWLMPAWSWLARWKCPSSLAGN